MMTSIYSGVSGLKAQQQKLDVIGNNLANINTIGYKGQTVSFADLLSQTISGATAANSATGSGGTNAKQIGTGVAVSATTTNMSTGSSQSTGNSSDVAIGGSGFFIVQGGGTSNYQFTRAGNFGVDSSGNLTVNGLKVCGWMDYSKGADGTYTFDTQKTVEPINLFTDSYNGSKKVIAPAASTTSTVTGSVNAAATAHGTSSDLKPSTFDASGLTADASTTLTVYDSLGTAHDVQVKLYKVASGTDTAGKSVTSWRWEAGTSDSSLTLGSNSGYIAFDGNGKIVSDSDFATSFTLSLTNGSGAATQSLALDFSKLSSYSSSSGSSVTNTTNGYASGELDDFTIGSDGIIYGVYSNGQTQPLGMIGMANFTNPAGLEKIGSNLYVTTANSGDFTGAVAAGSNGTGALSSGKLEMSNVDLSEQFSEMMITQRAYQANSKVITAADECLKSVINMVS